MITDEGSIPAEPAGEAEGRVDQRRAQRRQVLKRAQLIFGHGGCTIDCLVLDESPLGVRVETPVMTDIPEYLLIRFSGGGTFNAARHWSAGTRLGLEFIGSRIYDDETLRLRKAARLALQMQGVPAAVHLLRDAEFFKNEDLREAAESAERALARLNLLLE